MTIKESIEDAILNFRVDLGLALYYPATHLMINPACRLLAMKPVTPMQLHILLRRYDAERRYSRAGYELMISFADTYLSDDERPSTCYPCVFSADGEADDTSVCLHRESPRRESGLLDVPNGSPPPEYCPLKKKKAEENHDQNEN